MSLWGKIFGSDEAIKSAIDGVKHGLDSLVYTGEEKADAAAKERSEARQMVVEWMKSTQGQNLARRVISLTITGIWVIQYFTAMLINVASVWMDDPHKLQVSSDIISSSAQQMNGAVMLILGFYFAAPHMGDIAKVALTRFGKGTPAT